MSGSSPAAAAGFGRVRERVLDYWVGPSWSHRLSDTVSVGLSPFFTYRAQRNRRSLTLEQRESGAVEAVFVGKEFEYNHVGVLGKLGLAWRPGHLELGATVTTPRARIWSDGKTVFNATVAGVAGTPLLSASTQTGLDSTYHSPWSVAGGATWRGERTAVHTTVEWFSAVDPYDILEPQAAEVAGSSATIPLTYVGAAKSVVNFGAGLEHRLGDTTTLYGGIARNNSPWEAQSETLASWDLTDVTAGISVRARGRARRRGHRLRVGQRRDPTHDRPAERRRNGPGQRPGRLQPLDLLDRPLAPRRQVSQTDNTRLAAQYVRSCRLPREREQDLR